MTTLAVVLLLLRRFLGGSLRLATPMGTASTPMIKALLRCPTCPTSVPALVAMADLRMALPKELFLVPRKGMACGDKALEMEGLALMDTACGDRAQAKDARHLMAMVCGGQAPVTGWAVLHLTVAWTHEQDSLQVLAGLLAHLATTRTTTLLVGHLVLQLRTPTTNHLASRPLLS